MNSSIPTLYKLAPLILVAVLSAAAYFLVASLEKGATSAAGKGKGLIEKAGELVDRVETLIEELDRPKKRKIKKRSDSASRTAQKRAKAREKAVKREPSKKEPGKQIVNFTEYPGAFTVKLNHSSNALGTFKVDRNAKGFRSEASAILQVMDMGEGDDKSRFVSGVIDFKASRGVGGSDSVSITLRGEGVKRVGLGILMKRKSLWLRWDFPDLGVSGKWQTYTVPFRFFDAWSYDPKSRKYARMKKGSEPERIDQLHIYIKPRHLDNTRSGKVWIDSMRLE